METRVADMTRQRDVDKDRVRKSSDELAAIRGMFPNTNPNRYPNPNLHPNSTTSVTMDTLKSNMHAYSTDADAMMGEHAGAQPSS